MQILKLDIPRNRVFGLDIVRACAIFFVVLGHGNQILPHDLAQFIRPIVLDGVTIFFVLSGFLIGRILISNLEKDGNSVQNLLVFWKRRWYRTLPNFFLVLTILTTLLVLFSPTFTIGDVALHYFFLQNLCWSPPWFFPEAWSISVEEWFYLGVPFLIYMLTKIQGISVKTASIVTIVFILVGSTVLRFIHFQSLESYDGYIWDQEFRKVVLMRLDSIMYGLLGAYLSYYSSAKWNSHKNSLFVLGLLFIAISQYLHLYFDHRLYRYIFSFSIISFSVLLLLPFLSTYHRDKGRIYLTITTLSLISYSLYLLHLTLIKGTVLLGLDKLILSQLAGFGVFIKYILFWLISIIASIILYKYWELPMMNLRDQQVK